MSLTNFKKFLLRGVKDENASDKAALIARLISVAMCLYYFVALCFFAFTAPHHSGAVTGCAVFLAFSFYSAYLTYHERTNMALFIYYLSTLAWVAICSVLFGFNSSIDVFMIIITLLVYTTNYLPILMKFVISLVVFGLELFLYIYQIAYGPQVVLGSTISNVIQILNAVILFISMTIVMAVFTNDTMKTEAKLAKYNEKLHKLAGQDPLTKLPNRRSILDYMKNCISSCDQHYSGMCVAMGDIDFFKKVNDTYGHDAGDEVLKSLANLFMENMKGKGMVARWGGEEFLFVYENMNLDDAAVYMEEMLRKVRAIHVLYGGNDITFTMTFGITDVDIRMDKNSNDEEITDNINSAVGEADQKLYYGKKNGRNKVVV